MRSDVISDVTNLETVSTLSSGEIATGHALTCTLQKHKIFKVVLTLVHLSFMFRGIHCSDYGYYRVI